MFREAIGESKLRARKLIHKRITDLSDLREIYAIGDVIGKGNFGTVVRAKHKETKVSWAIKVINKRQTIYLVFELCTESLAKIFKVKKQFQESETINIIKSLSSALAYLHRNDIVHRDLKLENILTADNPDDIDDKLFIKVTDFGLSAMRRGPGHENMLHDFCGTLTYMAPEMIVTNSYSQQCDVWSMGIIMYLLTFGKFPFFSGNDRQLCKLIGAAEIDFSALPCSPRARHLLSKLLVKNPAFRLTAAEVKNHPWISGVENSLYARSSNVLDMMHLWRNEMLETSCDDFNTNCLSVNKREIMQIAESKDNAQVEENRELNTLVSKNTNESSSKLLFPVINGTSQEISVSKSRTRQSCGFKKVCERTPSGLPDFSHIPAKVDSNLTNLRRRTQKKCETTRKMTS